MQHTNATRTKRCGKENRLTSLTDERKIHHNKQSNSDEELNMRKPQPSTTLAERLINIPIEAAYPYCLCEIEAAGHNTLFLALEKMSKDIKKRFKSGDDPSTAKEEAMMLIELCKKLNDDFWKDVYYISYAVKMGEFAEKCIASDPSNANAIELLGFYKLICKNVIYNRQ